MAPAASPFGAIGGPPRAAGNHGRLVAGALFIPDCAVTGETRISRDYTREIGLEPSDRRLSLPVTIAVFAVLAVAGVLIVRKVYSSQPVAETATTTAQVSSR